MAPSPRSLTSLPPYADAMASASRCSSVADRTAISSPRSSVSRVYPDRSTNTIAGGAVGPGGGAMFRDAKNCSKLPPIETLLGRSHHLLVEELAPAHGRGPGSLGDQSGSPDEGVVARGKAPTLEEQP